jgi:hypothetical protein
MLFLSCSARMGKQLAQVRQTRLGFEVHKIVHNDAAAQQRDDSTKATKQLNIGIEVQRHRGRRRPPTANK